ncbi:hypothetical protein RRG08_019640 [Elysia crispata]|uniref:Uncharacterized protein n=1 Tax=Elysia crispata TaxID=231223 RepID=A0AAE0ZUD9_9GAST|nr:hypothetical protein RRG08_019640 [Elysia crispata]
MQTTTSAIRPTSTPQPTTTSTPQPTTTSTTIRTWPTTPKQTTGTVSTDTSQLHNSDTTTFYAVSIQTVTSFGQDPNSEWAGYPGSFNSGRSSGGPHRRQIVVICFLLSIFSFYTALE